MMEFIIIGVTSIVVSYFYLKYAPMHDLHYVLTMRNMANETHRTNGDDDHTNIKTQGK
jgi:hypothetical protein